MKIENDATFSKAKSLFMAKQWKASLPLIKKVNKSQKNFESLFIEGICLFNLDRLEKALTALLQALPKASDNKQKSQVLAYLGLTCSNLGKLNEAIDYYEKSLELVPGVTNARCRRDLCVLYQAKRQWFHITAVAKPLLALDEYHNFALLVQLDAKMRLNETQSVEDLLRKVSHVFTDFSDTQKSIALDICIASGDFSLAEKLIELCDMDTSSWVTFYKAALARKRKQHKLVNQLLTDDFIATCPDFMNKSSWHKYKADALEKLGEYDQAYRHFTAMSVENMKSVKQNPPGNSIAKMKKWGFFELNSVPTEPDAQKLVFMVGFPRSGTTLLDTMLDTQSRIKTFSEIGSFQHLRDLIRDELGLQFPRDLKNLNVANRKYLRDAYFAYLKKFRDYQQDDVLVDKTPLYIIDIPLILSLFPEAKIILSLRHPLDVCISNFQQNFELNEEMSHLVTIEGCFKRYRDVFELFNAFEAHYGFDYHIVRYESLVQDTQKVSRDLFDYLGLELEDSLENYHEINKSKIIRTPSADQVTQPLYKQSIAKYQNYKDNIHSLVPIVAPYIKQFGYDYT